MTNIDENKRKALEAVFAKINKSTSIGKDKDKGVERKIGWLGDKGSMEVKTFSTGSLMTDVALGVGGLPRGRIVEIYGPESSGKTTLCLNVVASAQREGAIAAFVDAEHALDPEWAAKIGVDTDQLIITQPDSGEDALRIVEDLIDSKVVDLIIVDSVAALVPEKERDGEIGDSHVGLQARMMSQALRKIGGKASINGTTVIFINQLREKIGVFFGSPETTTGGKALKFYASVRMDIRRIETLKEGNEPVGNRVRIKIVKNKVAAPFKQAETDILFAEGFSREGDILDLAIAHGIIRKAGAWFSDMETSDQIGQGRENARKFLKDNPQYRDEVEARIREIVFAKPVVALEDEDDEVEYKEDSE